MSSSTSPVRTLLLSFALLFAAASGAQAQVTIESVVWDWVKGDSVLNITAVNTSVGSNTALLAAVCLNNNDGQLPVSVVLDPGGASPDTLDWLDVGDQASSWSDTDDGHCTIWGAKSPVSGTSLTVRVLLDSKVQSTESLNVGVWSLSDVDQTTPFRDAVDVDNGTGTDAASITVPSQSGDLVFAAAFNEWYNGNTRLAVSGTGIEDFDIPGVTSEDLTVGQHKTATGTNTTLTWTNDNDPSPKWAVIGVAVIPAAATCPGGSVCWDGGAGGGNPEWSNGLNWTGDAVPGPAALVVFNDLSSNPATFDVADAIGSLTIEASYTGTITMAADLTNDGVFVMNGGTLNLGSTTVNQNDDWTYTAGVINAGTSTVVFASQDLTVTPGAVVFNDVTLNMSANTLWVIGTMDVNGDLTINSADGIKAGTIAVAGDVTTTDIQVYESNGGTVLFDGSGPQTLSASGGAGGLPRVEINKSGTLTIQDTIHVNDNWTFTGGTVDAGTSTVIFDGSDLSITTGTMAFNNVVVNFGGANTITLPDNFDIDGDLTLTNAGDGFSGAGTIEVAGNLTSTWVSCCGSNAITLDGANAQTVDIATGDITSGLFTINKTNPTDIVTLASAMPLSGSGQDLTITQGVLALGAFDLTVADVLTVDANGDITCTTGTVSALSETGAGLPYNCGNNSTPTVASAIPDTTVVEDNAPIDNYRDLKAVFTDVEDGSALTYSIESNTNSGLVTATIVVADSTLDLSFTASTGGTATITVRATDSGGLWVEDVFTVTTSCPAGSVCWDGGGGGDPNWSNGLNWTGDAVPGYSALVVFNHLSSNPATFNAVDTIGGFTIEADYTGTITMAADLLIDHTAGCTFTQNGGTIDLGSVTWEHECPWTHTAGTFTAGTSTVKYRYSHIAMDAGTSVFNDVSIGINNTDFTVTDSMLVNGNLTITSARNILTGTIKVAGDVTTTDSSVGGATGIIEFTGTDPQVLSASGGTGALPNININKIGGGTLTIQDTIQIDAYLGSGWTYTTAGDVVAGTSTVRFDQNTSVNSGSMKFNNVILNNSTDLTVTGTMDVDGDLTITNFRNLKSGTITVAGDLTSTDTSVGDNTGLIILDGANAQSIDINLGDVPNGLFTINKTSQSDIVTLSSAMDLSASGQDLTLTSGTLDMAGFNLDVADALTLDPGTQICKNGGILTVIGLLTNNGSISETCNVPPTVASAIADTTVSENSSAIDNYRDLKAVFTDAEDGSGLTYTIQSNTNSGLVTATFVTADSTLDLSFTASATGTATITVRATDSGSSFVDDVFTVTVADQTAPATVTLATGTATSSSIDLSWTAPGDDGATGTATTYDVRYSTSTINEANWGSAQQASGEPSPQVASSSESFTVTGLIASTTYYFAIKTSDEVPNVSAISNVPSGTTGAPGGGSANLENVATATNVGSSTSYTLNFGWTATAGRLLVLTASWDKDVTSLVELTDATTTWTQVDYRLSGIAATGAMYYKVADGTETKVRLQWTNSEDISIRVAEYSGIVSVDPLDVSSSDVTSGETTTVSTGTTAATAQADELAIAMMGSDSGGNTTTGRSWNNGFTEVTWLNDSSGDPGLSVAEKDLTSTGTVQTTFTTTDSGDEMVAIVATFKLEPPPCRE